MGYTEFLNLKGLIVGGIIFVASMLFWFAWHFWLGRWWKKTEKNLEVPDDMLEESIEKVKAAKAVPANTGYTCKCGANYPLLKDMQTHMLAGGRKDGKGVHGIASKPNKVAAEEPKESYAEISETGKYKAYVWERNTGIVFARITKPVGKLWLADTTLPHSGACYFCKRDGQGHLVPYDPRLEQFNPDNSPERLYRATNALEVVAPYYTALSTGWEKFKALLPYIVLALVVLAIIVKAGS